MNRSRRWTRAAILVAAAALLGATGGDQPAPRTAAAAEAGAEPEWVQVTAGFGADSRAVRDTWTPVEVVIEPDRLVAGELALVADTFTGRVLERRRVEIPAASRQLFRFVSPPARAMEVRFKPDGGESVRVPVRTVGSGGAFLVGMLGGVPDGMPAVAALATGQRGIPVGVDPAWVERSPQALESLGTLVAPVTALSDLTDRGRRNLAAAVASGLDLTVVAEASGRLNLAGLPWSPALAASPAEVALDGGEIAPVLGLEPTGGAWGMRAGAVPGLGGEAVVAAAVPAGRGRVAVTGVAPGRGPLGRDGRLWSHLLQPGASAGGSLGDGPFQPLHAAAQALSTGGLEIPSLPWLSGFLLAYVLLVGPVNGLVLSRIGRRELAWLTVPAITLLFSVGAFVGAARSQPPVGLSGEVRWWVDGAGSEMLATAVRAPTPGTHTVALPGDGWQVLAGQSRQPAAVEHRGDQTVVDLDLAALQVGTVMGWRSVEAPPPLEVAATATADAVEVRVTNVSPVEVRDMTVRAATATRRVGRLAPGESTTVTVAAGSTLPVVEPWDDGFQALRDHRGLPRAPVALLALLRLGPMTGDPGMVWATGTVPGSATIARAGDRTAQDLGAVVAVGAAPVVTGEVVSPFAVQRALLTAGQAGDLHRPGPLAVEGSGEVVLRYRLPQAGRVTALVSTLDRGFGGGLVEGLAPPAVEPPPPAVRVPPCPQDAVSCEFTTDGWEFCFPDGSCQGGSVAVPVPDELVDRPGPVSGARLEVYDHVEGAWLPAAMMFGDGGSADDDGGDPARLLSPLGEVHVRAAGELFPFDFSGRGIGARLEGGAA